MNIEPEPPDREVLAGLVERVTYHNIENGFCVVRAQARGHRDVVTMVGHAATISAGEWITASGEWVNDRTHGQQFKARFLRTSPPTSAEGIERYLSSGMIRGVGPVYAKNLVRAFGEKVFEVIETTPDRLREVEGIGPVRAASILAAWAEQKSVREIMVFLHSHGVGTARAVRIFKTYGSDAIQVMSENPYRLARDIRGIGFKTADAIAMKLGIEKTAIIRVRAGISYALTEAMDEGHCGWPTDELRSSLRLSSRRLRPRNRPHPQAGGRGLSGPAHINSFGLRQHRIGLAMCSKQRWLGLHYCHRHRHQAWARLRQAAFEWSGRR
jgi:exodeoxyribonuclease V alpha subunit